jgi:DNA-binding MarR family transcriptional regulator
MLPEDNGEAPLTKADYEALAEFRHMLRRFLRFSEEQAQAAGLTPQQHQALLAILGNPGKGEATVGDIAERLQIRHHSAVGLVQRLARLSLVEQRRADDDRRRVLVAVTPAGRTLMAGLSKAHRRELRRVGPLLRRMLGQLEGAAEEPAIEDR